MENDKPSRSLDGPFLSTLNKMDNILQICSLTQDNPSSKMSPLRGVFEIKDFVDKMDSPAAMI